MRYGIVIGRTENNFTAYVPDLPGCVATGNTCEDVRTNIQEAIELHLEGMRQDGDPIPEPQAVCDYVEVM